MSAGGSSGAAPGRGRSADDSGEAAGSRFTAAVSAARGGRYARAVELLQEALAAGECAEAEALDLHARICAQQGFHLEAESCWARAKRVDPRNPGYDRSLARLRRDRVPASRLRRLAIAGAIAALLGLTVWQTAFRGPSTSRRLAGIEDKLAAIEGTLRREIGNLDERRVASDRSQAEAVQSIDAALGSLGKAVVALEPALGERLEIGDAALAERVHALEGFLQWHAAAWPSRDDLASLSRTVASLQEQIAQLRLSVQAREMQRSVGKRTR